MGRKSKVMMVLLALVLITGNIVSAQSEGVSVSEFKISALKWGQQQVSFDITNGAELPKTFVVKAVTNFTGTYLSPACSTQANYEVYPGDAIAVEHPFRIPGNYGTADIRVEVYDVLDTLDELLPYQMVASQPFKVSYGVPDELHSYLQEEITLPPMVSNSHDFETEFSRLQFLLIQEGKTIDEIAALAQCEADFVYKSMDDMVRKGYLSKGKTGYALKFPFITTAEAEEARKLAEEVADEVVALVAKNLPAYDAAMDSMIAAGSLESTGDDVLHGGSVLYYKYPVITALFFWNDLGRHFVNPSKHLAVLHGTDMCNARNPEYMYAVQGGPYFNGTAFFLYEHGHEALNMTYFDTIPGVTCIPDFADKPTVVAGLHWVFTEENEVEPFSIDTVLVNAALGGLGQGKEAVIESAKTKLKAINDKYGHETFSDGTRYWFWNIVASRAVIKMVDQGVVNKYGGGRYFFEELPL